jgi:hypothetical protein
MERSSYAGANVTGKIVGKIVAFDQHSVLSYARSMLIRRSLCARKWREFVPSH